LGVHISAAPFLGGGGVMDDRDEFFYHALFWIVVGPFWLVWHAVRLSWQLIAVPLIEHGHDRAASAETDRQADVAEPARQTRQDERARQLDELKAAVPITPLERMRATIQLHEFKRPRLERVRITHIIGEDSFVYQERGEDTKFSVDMVLELTETERAIIKQYELDDIVLETLPAHTEAYLAEMRAMYDSEIDATRDMSVKEVRRLTMDQTLAQLKAERNITRVGDLLVSPYSRVTDSPHEAKQYADKLKTQFLPAVRKLIDSHGSAKQSETLEF